jgi:hypothetical protein
MNLWWWLPIEQAGFEIAKPIMLLEKIATSLWL